MQGLNSACLANTCRKLAGANCPVVRCCSHIECCTPRIADATPAQIEDVTSFHTMTDLWPSRESFGSRLALRPCSPLLSDAGTLQRARSLGGFVRPKFSKTSPDFGFPSAASASVMLREKTPTAGVLSENTRAEYRAAELERVLKEDFAFQNKAHSLKTGFPEMDSYKDSLESGLREEQFRQDHRRTSCSCFSPIACLVIIYRLKQFGPFPTKCLQKIHVHMCTNELPRIRSDSEVPANDARYRTPFLCDSLEK